MRVWRKRCKILCFSVLRKIAENGGGLCQIFMGKQTFVKAEITTFAVVKRYEIHSKK